MTDKKVLITGAAGYIASQVLPTFRERYETVLLDITDRDRQGRRVEGVAIVDLMGKRPFHSKAVKVTLSGASVGKGGHVLAPGGSLKLDFMLPATTRDAELVVTHAPEGTGTACFVTMTFADQTLVGRYAPPKADKGRARVERWNLTPHLADPVQGGEERGYTLFIYNNQNAGSTEGYRLAGVELYYRVE